MKLQAQDNQSDSILGEGFEKVPKKRHQWLSQLLSDDSAKTLSRLQIGLLLGVLWLVLCSTVYVCTMIIYAPAFRQIAGIDNPLSVVRDIARNKQAVAQIDTQYVDTMSSVEKSMGDLAELRSTQAITSNPVLVAVKSIRDGRPAWDHVLRDINAATKQTVQSNDILQRIVLGSLSFTSDTAKGVLTKMKVYANGDQSSLSLAARFVQALETTPSIKSVQSSDPVTQQETSTGAILSFTPLDISFDVQKEDEVTGGDNTRNVQQVRDDVRNLLNQQ